MKPIFPQRFVESRAILKWAIEQITPEPLAIFSVRSGVKRFPVRGGIERNQRDQPAGQRRYQSIRQM